jgi:hypothetical protein
MALWWMSFADPGRSKGQQFLGLVILEAPTPREAMQKAWDMEINPGGQIMFIELPNEMKAEYERYMNRLLQKVDLIDIGVAVSDIDSGWRERVERDV